MSSSQACAGSGSDTSAEPAPIGFLSAEENAILILRIRGWDADAAGERAAEALIWAGLADRARQRVHRLSAGEAQRLALARALASARGLLIVDEPTSRQDENNARAIAALLAGGRSRRGSDGDLCDARPSRDPSSRQGCRSRRIGAAAGNAAAAGTSVGP